MRIRITIVSGKHTYVETIEGADLEDAKEYFQELVTNGANLWMVGDTFEHAWRPIKVAFNELNQFNVCDREAHHMIYGWWESFCQSDSTPQWLSNTGTVEVEHLS